MTKRETGDAPPAQREESDNVTTPEVTVTIQTFLDELEQSGRKLKKSSKGHRALLRDTLQTAQRIIVKFLKNETLRKQFVRALEKEAKNGRREAGPANWSLEVVAKATGASSRQTRKLASKRAGVLEFLRERNVPVKKTAITIKKEGLEKLYSEWCKKKKQRKADEKVKVPFWMKPGDRDQLLGQKEGAKLTVLVSRVSKSDGDFHVKGVMLAHSLGDDVDDWEDLEE
ncbi:hypothetical protein [Bradyrhizobium sp. CCBAU 53380]|uniref:hypothetical protein n=1 Tax=Bradyrhizobium sp. CCBAU 53380 TaxID=1325117 RepID=UPI002302AC38|nr:hypothetical protein [Bradyrhizobium sp. CCBAU 53380]MDA9420635.1 hypothetical protein [Bradyrhizobium sp. CCBAU 53380]